MHSYIIITPVRDEAKYIEHTIKSVTAQTVKPRAWIIVDDGSTDETSSIIDKYVKEYGWVQLIQRKDRGYRKAGGGVIDAFYEGYAFLSDRDWEFVVKLDGDLSFAPDYFERCFEHFDSNPNLGIGGGMIFNIFNAELCWEPHPMFHVRGATKIYRRECWTAIGGIIRAPGWDTLDEVKANMLGWETRTFQDLQLTHHRFTGSVDGAWRNWVKNGRANYISGYHPVFMFTKCLKRLIQKPYLIGSMGLMYGFLSGYVKKVPQISDPMLIKYIRKQQIRRLLLRESIWK